jgi:hypothetical protein
LEIPETSVLLRGERNAVGLTAVFSVTALAGTRENPRTKIIFYGHWGLLWWEGRKKKPSRPDADG